MFELPPPLTRFIESLEIKPDGSIFLAGRQRNQSGRTRNAAPNRRLADDLAVCLYENVYTRPDGPILTEDAHSGPDQDLTEVLARANTTSTRTEHGWTVQTNLPNGGVIAHRHGRTRQLLPGQFLVTKGKMPAEPGTQLMAMLPAGSHTQQPGFYFCFSEGFLDAHDRSPLVRLYWNVRIPGAGPLVHLLTSTLNRYQIPFQLKVTTQGAAFARADNAVLYVAQRVFAVVALALEPTLPQLAGLLDPAVPLFTKRLAEGLGFAEDPGPGESFGTSRCKLLASALIAAREGERVPLEAFSRCFEEAVRTIGLTPTTLYLNPGSHDIYPWPSPLSSRHTHPASA